MSASLTSPTQLDLPTDRQSAAPRLAFGVVGAALTVNGLVLAPQLFFNSRDYSEIAASPTHLAHYVVWAACLVALSQLYPALAGLRGRDGRGIPGVVLRVAAVGAALAACAQFVAAFVNPFLADHDPALLDTAPDPILLVPLLVTTGLAGLATAAVGVVGGVRRALPVPAAVLIVLGGLVIPVLGPMANALLGVGLVLIAWRGCWSARESVPGDSAHI